MRRLSVAAIALVGIGGIAVPATSSVASAHRIRHVTYDAALQPTGGTAPCDPTTPARCAGTFENVITYTGGITGTSFAVGAAALAPDGVYRAMAIEQFTGTIAGCGTGTVVIRQTGTLDPDDGPLRGLVGDRPRCRLGRPRHGDRRQQPRCRRRAGRGVDPLPVIDPEAFALVQWLAASHHLAPRMMGRSMQWETAGELMSVVPTSSPHG